MSFMDERSENVHVCMFQVRFYTFSIFLKGAGGHLFEKIWYALQSIAEVNFKCIN